MGAVAEHNDGKGRAVKFGKRAGRPMVFVLAVIAAVGVMAGGALAQDGVLELSKSASPNPATVGEPLTFTLTQTNNRPFDLDEPDIRDFLPDSVEFVSATPSQGVCELRNSPPEFPTSRYVQCNPGPLAVGATVTIEIVVIPQRAGTLTNEAVNVGEQQASATVTVSTPSAGGGGGAGAAQLPAAGGPAMPVLGGALVLVAGGLLVRRLRR